MQRPVRWLMVCMISLIVALMPVAEAVQDRVVATLREQQLLCRSGIEKGMFHGPFPMLFILLSRSTVQRPR